MFFSSFFGFYRWRTFETRRKLVQEKRVNLRLQRVDKLKDQFLANTSHELRTPLTGIIGLAESLKDGAAGEQSSKAKKNLGMIVSSGRRLSTLINDILDFSKLKSHELQLDLAPIDVYAITDVVIHLSQPLTQAKDVKLMNMVPKDLPPVEADENRLQQILFNLVGNAIKFTDSGYVKVSANIKDDEVILMIEDTGIGIPEDKLETIFSSFEQIEGDDSRSYGGTGLGLTVTKQLVELHGGSISVESELGSGAIFSFSLPKSDKEIGDIQTGREMMVEDNGGATTGDDDTIDEAIEEEISVPMQSNGIRLLIVDDEPINLEVLDNHLTMQGYEVVQAQNGEEALKLIEDDKDFDLILLDIMMPKMSGYEVCEKLREAYLPNELPVVMVTAKTGISDIVQGLDTGANDYLTKPFSKDELLSRIKTHLNLHSINKAMGRFVPGPFLRAIGRESITEVKLGDLADQEVTVLFSDIRGFTSLSEELTPKDNFRLINAYNSRMGPIIRANGGFINQYFGDGIMAIFPKDSDGALLASIKMQKKLAEYNSERMAADRMPINVGMGIHTGPLVMGVTGDGERLNTTVIADTVNITSRIEGLTKHYGVSILISEICKKALANPEKFIFRFLGQVKVKGKKNPNRLYEIVDGELDEMMAKKLKSLEIFNKGVEQYYAQEFPSACVAFEETLKINPDDATAKLFLANAGKYIAQGVPDDWTGIEEMS